MQAITTELQTRIEQNRQQTKALLMRRLMQSHREHKDVAATRIARRRAFRYCINTIMTVAIVGLMMWAVMNYWDMEIALVQRAEISASVQKPVSAPFVTGNQRPAHASQTLADSTEAALSLEEPQNNSTLHFESELSKTAAETQTINHLIINQPSLQTGEKP